MAAHGLEHTGPAIVEEYYPTYASDHNRITPLYSSEVYIGSALMLLAMSMLGLPITAIGYMYSDHNTSSAVSTTWAIVAAVGTVVLFLAGLAVCAAGFRKHKVDGGHH